MQVLSVGSRYQRAYFFPFTRYQSHCTATECERHTNDNKSRCTVKRLEFTSKVKPLTYKTCGSCMKGLRDE